jgi:hypothetical protein
VPIGSVVAMRGHVLQTEVFGLRHFRRADVDRRTREKYSRDEAAKVLE